MVLFFVALIGLLLMLLIAHLAGWLEEKKPQAPTRSAGYPPSLPAMPDPAPKVVVDDFGNAQALSHASAIYGGMKDGGISESALSAIADMASQHVRVEVVERGDLSHDPEVKVIKDEIRGAVGRHRAAVSLLHALARLDGQTSQEERELVFTFLLRQGEALVLEKHGPWFGKSRAEEWYRTIEPDELWALLDELRPMADTYRADVVATADALMVAGGKPKASKVSTMKEIRKLLL